MTDDTHSETDRRTTTTDRPTTDRSTSGQTAATDGGTDTDATTTSGDETVVAPNTAESTGARLRRLVDYLALAGLALLALVAGIQVYTAIDATISRFVVREYRPLFRGVINLALLLLAAGGVTLQLRRLR